MSDSPFLPPSAPLWQEAPPPSEPPLPPLPWEDPERFPGFWSRIGGMFSLVFSDPLGYFERVPSGAGLLKPWQFLMLLLAPVWAMILLVVSMLGAVGLAGLLAAKGGSQPPVWLFTVLLPAFVVLMPGFVFLGMILGGALNHGLLWLWGGLRQGRPLEQTIRAQGYAQAFISLGALIPYLGFLVQLAGLVWLGMGLARLHRTDTWRGICAVLTPVFLVCCCGLGLLLAVPALVAAGAR